MPLCVAVCVFVCAREFFYGQCMRKHLPLFPPHTVTPTNIVLFELTNVCVSVCVAMVLVLVFLCVMRPRVSRSTACGVPWYTVLCHCHHYTHIHKQIVLSAVVV